MEDFDERALLERCRGGDDAAFGELVDRYKNLVFGLVYRMAPERSQAEDLAQEVLLEVHRGLPYFRGEARLSTWIYRIVLDSIERIAAGEVEVTEEARAHLETCPRCASALASARRLEAALASREAPLAPPGFTASVVARVRRDRWHAEQRLDRAFNLVILAGAAGLAASVWALLNVEVVLAAASAFRELAAGMTAGGNQASGPSLVAWVGAAAFIGFALGLWWWTEQRFSS